MVVIHLFFYVLTEGTGNLRVDGGQTVCVDAFGEVLQEHCGVVSGISFYEGEEVLAAGFRKNGVVVDIEGFIAVSCWPDIQHVAPSFM